MLNWFYLRNDIMVNYVNKSNVAVLCVYWIAATLWHVIVINSFYYLILMLFLFMGIHFISIFHIFIAMSRRLFLSFSFII